MNHTHCVENEMEKFQQLGCQVVAITNGTRKDGLLWQTKLQHPNKAPVLVDSDWLLYRKLGLRRYCDIFTTETMISYGELMVSGVSFPKLIYDDDDLCIMGGDFIVQRDGKLVYALKQYTYNQRPSVEELLSFLEEQIAHK